MQLIHSKYDELTGISICDIKYKGIIYRGIAQLHLDDRLANKGSKFTGCRFAEMRAQIKALKAEYKEEKAVCEECRKFVKACTQYKNFDNESPTAKAMFRQLNRRIKRVNDLADKINEKINALQIAIKQKDIVSKALEKHSQNKNN